MELHREGFQKQLRDQKAGLGLELWMVPGTLAVLHRQTPVECITRGRIRIQCCLWAKDSPASYMLLLHGATTTLYFRGRSRHGACGCHRSLLPLYMAQQNEAREFPSPDTFPGLFLLACSPSSQAWAGPFLWVRKGAGVMVLGFV